MALFSGIGGGILGGKLLGWRTVCAVEQDPYCISVLLQRQNEGFLSPFPIWDDVCTFDGKPWRGVVDVVSGGFPCTDISVAGKGAGIKGKQSGLWSEMARIIGEVQPRFAFIENSPMLVTRGLDTVLCDLAAMGFDAKWGCISAAEVGANHKRDRIWIVARMWPTPTAGDHARNTIPPSIGKSRGFDLSMKVLQVEIAEKKTGGQLCPIFVEYLMGWPLEWTDLKPLEMDKFQKWLELHGRY